MGKTLIMLAGKNLILRMIALTIAVISLDNYKKYCFFEN